MKNYQAKHPTNATNLSRSFAPNELITVVNKTNANLKRFFAHLTCMLPFPLLVNKPFSIIRIAGKSCSGIDKRMASAYKNCTLRAKKISQTRKKVSGKDSLSTPSYSWGPSSQARRYGPPCQMSDKQELLRLHKELQMIFVTYRSKKNQTTLAG